MTSRTCATCGSPLRGDASDSRCAACLLGVGLDEAEPAVTTGLRARSRPAASPDRIGPYRLLSVLGEGGFGVVYLAEQEAPLVRRVALKLIKLGMDSHEVIARFETEQHALALMDHPNIAKVLDAGITERGTPYFVMEHVSGESITAYCDRHRLGVKARLALFIQACRAVQHAHQKGIVHRDIKPSNVLVTVEDGEPRVKVIDFGISRALDARRAERSAFTERGVIIGTPAYMSPEQAAGDSAEIDTTTDVYSLGVLLYELLTGVLPFDARRLAASAHDEMLRMLREDEPLPMPKRFMQLGELATDIARNRHADSRSFARALGGDLDWITRKALEKDRTRRYASASEFATDVRRHLDDEPVEARPPSPA